MSWQRSLPVLFILVFSVPAYSAHESEFVTDSDSVPVFEKRYQGGSQALRAFLIKHLRYPGQAIHDNIMGLSISSITVARDGSVVKVSIINSLGPAIDKEILRLLKRTEKHWLSTNTTDQEQTFYFQILFKFIGINFHTSMIVNEKVMEPIAIVASGLYLWSGKYRFFTEANLSIKIDFAIGEERYADALEFLNEAIRRNPFIIKNYQYRILCCQKLGKIDQMNEDVVKLRNFIDNRPLKSFVH